MKKILAVGSPLVDVLIHVDDEYLKRYVSGAKGGMEMISREEQDKLISHAPVMPVLAPGGAAGNTVFTLARLGAQAAMFGCTGDDDEARFYADSFRRFGGEPRFVKKSAAGTGRCVSLVTPDTERTMRTDLGASQLLTPADVEAMDFSDFGIVYVEGYLLFLKDVVPAILRKAKAAGCVTAMDLASFEIVGIFKDSLSSMIRESVDWVFANEDEASALLGENDPERTLALLGDWCDLAVVKLGARGSLAKRGTEKAVIAPVQVKAVDTTAAGDTYAAGFIYALANGKSLEEAGQTASLLAAEVVQVTGSLIPEERWVRARSRIGF